MLEQKNKFDVIVIGAGSGGLTAAELGAKLGARVMMVEANPNLGGECLNAGCVPSKALIHAARVFWEAGHSQHIGVTAAPTLDYAAVQNHVRSAITSIEQSHDNDEYYESRGVTVVHGKANFTGPRTISVNDESYSAKKIIIATGSGPLVPDIPGLQDGPYLTNESIFDTDTLPASLTVIGGGPIGCELGQAFAMLGCKVTIVQTTDRLLPRDEAEPAAALLSSMKAMGVSVELNAAIESVTYSDSGSHILLKGGGVIQSEALLVATGRQARVPEGLEAAGINMGQRGITVDSTMRTSNKRIFAIGDCNGGLQFTHAAGEQAGVAIQNALFGTHKKFDPLLVPWTTFTTPEIAHFGPIKSELDAKSKTYQVLRLNYNAIDKAVAETQDGYIEIVTGEKQAILAATIVGTNAAEILARIVTSPSISSLATGVQAYPTYAIGVRQLAVDANLDSLLESFTGKLLKIYARR